MAIKPTFVVIVSMDGRKMNTKLVKDYFSNLLNTNIEDNTIIRLSSGQGARAYAWLKNNSFNVDNTILYNSFTLQELFTGIKKQVDRPSYSNHRVKNQTPHVYCGHDKKSIGIDIQSIKELFPIPLPTDFKSDKQLLEIFTTKELSYAESKDYPLQTLTGLFAAKEAIQKCSQEKLSLKKIEILPDENGKPCTDDFSISISHSLDYAIAVAIVKHNQVDENNLIHQDCTNTETSTSTQNNSLKKDYYKELILILVLIPIFFEVLRFFSIL